MCVKLFYECDNELMRDYQCIHERDIKGASDAGGASESEVDMSRERRKFAANMFGSDFDMQIISEDSEETMRILQEKSFRGLFLRLQFWINQICKSLHGKNQDMDLQLHFVH